MSLETIVDLQISRTTATPTRVGFGIPLIAAVHDVSADLVIPFSSTSAMVDAGFLPTDPAYLAAQVAFSQNPRPSLVCVGKRQTPFTKVVRLLPKNIKKGFKYSFKVVDPAGVITSVEYVVQTADTVAIICAALAALIDPVANVTAVVGGGNTYVTLTAVVGKIFDLTGLPNARHMEVNDVTTDPGIAADLDAILEFDPLTWYALTLDSQSPAEILAAAPWVETKLKIFCANSTQSDIVKTGSGDVASTVKASNYARTGLLFSGNRLQSYSAMGWFGKQLPKDPGSSNWMFKVIVGIIADILTDGQQAQLTLKRCNSYQDNGGVSITGEGWTGDGSYFDIAHGADWLRARIKEAVFGGFVNTEKVSYTDSGAASIVNLILGVLRRGVKSTFLAPDPKPTCTVGKIADADVADKLARILDGVEFEATLAGAINHVRAKGKLLP